MKTDIRLLFLTGGLAAAIASCSSPKTEGYQIEGKITDVPSGTIYLKCYQNGQFNTIDSTTITDGNFVFKGQSKEPLVYGLTTIEKSRRPLTFLIGNETVQATLNESEKSIEITGSTFNDTYARNEQVADFNTIDSLISKDPASPANAYLFARNCAPQMDYTQVNEYRQKFAASLNGTEYINQIDTLLSQLKNLQVGAVAPDFTLPDTEGNPVQLSSLRGNYVLIDFWASWCPDCRKENPNVVTAYNTFKDEKFKILGVSLDTKKEPWINAIEKDNLTWMHVSDLKGWDSDIARLYVIKWIPRNYLLDPDGVILASGLEGEALTQKLQEIFKK